MNPPFATLRMTRPMLLIAAILVSLAYAIWGVERAGATLVGVTVGLGNWFALRWLVQRMIAAGPAGRTATALLLVGKIGLLMAVVFVLISRLGLDPIGVAFGLGILFLGPVIAGLLSGTNGSVQSLDPSAASAAREER